MKPDNFEPSQDDQLSSFDDVLETATEDASIDEDLANSLSTDQSRRSLEETRSTINS